MALKINIKHEHNVLNKNMKILYVIQINMTVSPVNEKGTFSTDSIQISMLVK